MRIKRRFAVILALASAGVLAAVGIAMAATSTVTLNFTPSDLPTSSFKFGQIQVHTSTNYGANPTQETDKAKLNFDDSIKVDTSATPKCPIGNITGKTLQGAMKPLSQGGCKEALVGKGTAKAEAGPNPVNACVRAFNGKPRAATGNVPTVLLFTRAKIAGSIDCSTNGTQGDTSVVLEGALTNNPSSLPGDFTGGKQLLFKDITSVTPFRLTDFNVKAGKPIVSGLNYVAAKCNDGDHKLNLKTTFTYVNPSGTQTVNASKTCS